MFDVRLFRLRTFNTALAVNFLAIFVAIGYFLFIAQYLQLVIGLSPLEAGLWSVPSALGFVAGSQVTPHIAARVGPHRLIAGGLTVAAVGLALLLLVGRQDGALAVLILASVVISLGFAPVFGLTTELIVGSAPPERAGAASGISETAAELGGALGLAILGSVGVAVYRSELAGTVPTSVPPDAVSAARDTLGGAVEVAGQLPPPVGAQLADAAHGAFVDGMHTVGAIAAAVAVAVAVLAWRALRPTNIGAAEVADDQDSGTALDAAPEPAGC
jgi:DHA2 family multidrug resistance protein-like MFS transporter